MIFPEYEDYERKYKESQSVYDSILLEKEKLFEMTQPKAMRFDKERVAGGDPENAFDLYLERKDATRIDDRLIEAEKIVKDRKALLDLKKDDLYKSHEILDKIFRMNRIERIRPYRIARILNYSVSQIYRYIEQIDAIGKDAKKCEKKRVIVKA